MPLPQIGVSPAFHISQRLVPHTLTASPREKLQALPRRGITFGTCRFDRMYREIAASHGFLAMTAPAALGAAAPVYLKRGLPRRFAPRND